ncbi:hypothetical protein VKT23_016959 [Stygiomarasmius scandens]|uniref:Uncharacterized protein n=1 Tax=Marasmiellus scandens TaxID=2682957 RepID=A0ABR1IUZ8_9AGAR
MALIAPELVVIWALRQWLASRWLAKEYADLGWKQVHGFFAIMGGFVLYDKNMPQNVILAHELTSFRERSELRVSAQEIWDKSKGDLLSKGLVLLQTFWFIFQCVVRACQGLAITQLETVTLAFAAINFVIYGLWWNKPLGVECPLSVCREYEKESGRSGNGHAVRLTSTVVNLKIPRSQERDLSVWRMINRYLGLELIERVVRGRDDYRHYSRQGHVHHPVVLNSCLPYARNSPNFNRVSVPSSNNLPALDRPTPSPFHPSTASPTPGLSMNGTEHAPAPVQMR